MPQTTHLIAEEEARFDRETVARAAALAERLQEERKDGLSLAEVDALAAELGIDRHCMRQALRLLSHRKEQERARHSLVPLLVGTVGAALGAVFLGMLLLLGVRAARESASVATPAAPVEAAAPAVLNGGFESAALSRGRTEFKPGSTGLEGWTVVSGAVRLESGRASQGARSLALGASGVVRQMFRTEPGRRYRVLFDLSGEQGRIPQIHRVTATVDGYTVHGSAFTEPLGHGTPRWETVQVEIAPQEPGSVLQIQAEDAATGSRPLIDNVRLEPMP
ncbi:MAG TPA: DUF642 domain-containing protein [Armatimonadota bacterium]|nr:DUF642 domain-containing protein [Armatimonadota bacterium]